MNRILLLGATGQVGWELARSLMPIGSVVTPARNLCDFARPGSISAAADDVKPHIIVNAAAYTMVDQAEREPALVHTINADAPAEMASAARRHGALLVHYSSDYVFDGRKEGSYTEEDIPAPLNVYGRTKLGGEVAIAQAAADYLIFRTSWVYSARGSNFLRTVLRLARERDVLRVVDDQFGAPTWSRLIAETTALALQRDLARRREGNFRSALLHLTASGRTSWHGFATSIVRAARSRGIQLKCRDVVPITTAEYPLPAARPSNSCLSGDKLAERYGLHMPTWQRCLELCLSEFCDTGADAHLRRE